jgi:hypothetical protein
MTASLPTRSMSLLLLEVREYGQNAAVVGVGRR